MTRRSDLVYGRQGGRIVPARSTGPHKRCRVCDGLLTLGQRDEHLVCAELEGRIHPQRVTPKDRNR